MSVDAAVVSEIVRRVLREQGGAAAPQAVPVGVSNRHIHLTQDMWKSSSERAMRSPL